MVPDDPSDRSRFEAVFEDHYRDLLAYALRRSVDQADAEDVVAETYTIAWRRLADMPDGDGTRPWLYAVAHRVIANQRRGSERRFQLIRKVASLEPVTADPTGTESGPALSALARLRSDDQELLRLVAWEDLDHGEIGVVLGITPNAVAIRLHRARDRFVQEFRSLAQSDELKGFSGDRTYASWKGRRADQPGEAQRP